MPDLTIEDRMVILRGAMHVDIEDLVDAWVEALQAAHSIAKAGRSRELRGDRSVKAFAGQVHTYSVEWGRVYAIEAHVPGLSNLRMPEDGPKCDPGSVARAAARDAERQFEMAVREGVDDLWAI